MPLLPPTKYCHAWPSFRVVAGSFRVKVAYRLPFTLFLASHEKSSPIHWQPLVGSNKFSLIRRTKWIPMSSGGTPRSLLSGIRAGHASRSASQLQISIMSGVQTLSRLGSFSAVTRARRKSRYPGSGRTDACRTAFQIGEKFLSRRAFVGGLSPMTINPPLTAPQTRCGCRTGRRRRARRDRPAGRAERNTPSLRAVRSVRS